MESSTGDLDSCLGEWGHEAWSQSVQERVRPEGLKNKDTFEAFYSEGGKEKWNGSWGKAWGLGVKV